MITKEFKYVKSSKLVQCRKCGHPILAKTQCLKVTVVRTGAIKFKSIAYFCMDCETLNIRKPMAQLTPSESIMAGCLAQSQAESEERK